MYPNLYYIFKEWFGIEINGLRVVNSFGFFVAISFLLCARLLVKEFKRRQQLGQFTFQEHTVTVGEPATAGELLVNGLLGFLLGYKIVGAFVSAGQKDIQEYVFSLEGNWFTGLLVAALFAGLRWYEKRKTRLDKPLQKTERIWPSDRVGDMVVIAFVAGFIGAKIFDNLENWDRFIQDPLGNLLSPSGLTFYGGLIVATIAMTFYLRKHQMNWLRTGDAIAPGLMLAYAVGRIGCQVSGDGDWGIVNSAYITDATGKVVAATPEQFNQALQANAAFYDHHGTAAANLAHKATHAFAGLPDWLFAQSYYHNVNREGIPTLGCTWDDYCTHLPLPVYPTPLYELTAGLLLVALLWSLRKKLRKAGQIFSLYLIVNGIERFLVETIRVNTKYPILGGVTQAELISAALVIGGSILLFVTSRRKDPLAVA
jgi:phosphatidylglycerol:prolipoprotein diacylglycerol transferase